MIKIKTKKGFSLVEVLISVAVFSMVSIACYEAFSKILVYSKELEAKSLATMIVNEQFEIFRNIPYAEVGISGGIPSGVFPHTQTITRNNKTFEVTTTIRNHDDPFDGTIGGTPNDLSPADSKLVEVSVVCTNCRNSTPSTFTSIVSPKGLETSTTNGALFVRVFDGDGQSITGAEVTIRSVSGPSVLIEDVTNNQGMVQIVDIPPGVEIYEIIVTKNGYSTDKTYATTVANPHPIKPHATIITQQVTQISFAIDLLNNVNLYTKNLSCGTVGNVDFFIQGSKKIGLSPDIIKFSANYITSSLGQKQMNDLEWDTYNINLTDTAYDLAGSDPLLPLNLLPGASEDVVMYVVSKTAKNLLVLVKDLATGLPLTGAEVTLADGGYEETLVTNEGFLRQTDWSGGAGQDDFVDDTRYFSSDGNVDTTNPTGEVKLLQLGGVYVSSGSLVSSVFDIGTSTSVSFLRWRPTDQPVLAGTDSVKFQVASSDTNNATTTWSFVGPSGDSSTFYTTVDQDVGSIHSNKQYLRYKMYLSSSDNTVTPNVSDVAFTYASTCTPPGQVFFSDLDGGTYTLTVSKDGYQEQVLPVDVNTGGVNQIIELSP